MRRGKITSSSISRSKLPRCNSEVGTYATKTRSNRDSFAAATLWWPSMM
jgi:hypothetical protein